MVCTTGLGSGKKITPRGQSHFFNATQYIDYNGQILIRSGSYLNINTPHRREHPPGENGGHKYEERNEERAGR